MVHSIPVALCSQVTGIQVTTEAAVPVAPSFFMTTAAKHRESPVAPWQKKARFEARALTHSPSSLTTSHDHQRPPAIRPPATPIPGHTEPRIPTRSMTVYASKPSGPEDALHVTLPALHVTLPTRHPPPERESLDAALSATASIHDERQCPDRFTQTCPHSRAVDWMHG